MSDPVISVQNVSKAYRIWENPAARLTAPVLETLARILPGPIAHWAKAKAAKSYRDFWALKDVSFEVKKGEAVGIIGRNGSGKSTLLQIIAGTLQPTQGEVKVNGRVAALLELGSGFNPEFTGRENVYLNCSVLGLARTEIDSRFAAIVSFAEIGEFIERPVKTYSSGMMMRLAFACIIHVEPDILIVDEALSVGDIRFQRKCKEWIDGLTNRGVTFLFVSHSPAEITQITTRALLLEKGQLVRFGQSREVVRDYQRLLFGEEVLPVSEAESATGTMPRLPDARGQGPSTPIEVELNEADRAQMIANSIKVLSAKPNPASEIELRHGNRAMEIIDYGIVDEKGQRTSMIASGASAVFYFSAVSLSDFDRLFAAFVVRNVNGVELFYTNTELQKLSAGPVTRGDLIEVTSQVCMWLSPGDYFLSAVTRNGESLDALDRRLDVFHFQVTAEKNNGGGMVNLQADLRFRVLGNALS